MENNNYKYSDAQIVDMTKDVLLENKNKIKKLSKKYLDLQKKYSDADDELEQLFREMIDPFIESAKKLDDLHPCQYILRLMPDSCGKTLIWRKLTFKQQEIENGKNNN